METKWNVYAWYGHGKAIRVGTDLSIEQASAMVEAYLRRGLNWDAYMVEVSDDPAETIPMW